MKFSIIVAKDVNGVIGKNNDLPWRLPNDEVFKFLAPLIIDQEGLEKGFSIIEESIQTVLANY